MEMLKEAVEYLDSLDAIKYADQDYAEAIAIIKKEFTTLEKDSNWLKCLEAAGVDNYECINFAIDIYNERHGGDDDDE